MEKKKNAFTLIELLAIIVILAIIAVITVPIILNIIENSRKGAAQDSVHGYKDSINKYYLGKLSENQNYNDLDGEYTINSDGYLVENGAVKHQIQVSGQKPSGGTMTIQNKVITTACVQMGDYKVSIINGTVGQAEKGSCTVNENNENAQNNNQIDKSQWVSTILTSRASSTINSDGLIQITHSNEDVDYRYMGITPNNYIDFNCDDNEENCETWRIIGIFDDSIKIIRNESIGGMSWDHNSNDNDYNDWSRASLNKYLNGNTEEDYYYNMTSSAKSLIKESIWYLGGLDLNSQENITADDSYIIERGSNTYFTENCQDYTYDEEDEAEYFYHCLSPYPISVSKNIGIMYPSDYGFASSNCYTGTKALYDYDDPTCYGSNWLFQNNAQWFITVDTRYADTLTCLRDSGYFGSAHVYEAISDDMIMYVRPTVYLKPNIKFVGNGTGASNSHYKVELIN